MDGVDTDQQRNFQPALPGECLQPVGFGGRDYVQERADPAFGHEPFEVCGAETGVECVSVLVLREVFVPAPFGVQDMFDSHILAHLPDLLFEGHPQEKVLYTGLRRERRVEVGRFRIGRAAACREEQGEQQKGFERRFHTSFSGWSG